MIILTLLNARSPGAAGGAAGGGFFPNFSQRRLVSEGFAYEKASTFDDPFSKMDKSPL